MNNYRVDLENKRLVEVASEKEPERHPADYPEGSHLYKYWYELWQIYNSYLAFLTTYPLQSVPEGWVQDMVVEEGKDFLLQYEVYGTVMKGEWWPISEQLYDADKDSIKRIIAIPIVVSAAVEKFEQAIKEFGVDAAMEYFSTPDDAKEIIAKEIAESSPAGKEDEVKYLHELAAELRSLKQSIIESGLKKYSPVKDMSFHDKVVFAISTATDEGYWEKRAQAAEDVVKYWNSLGQVVRDDILHKWQSLVTSPVAETEGQDELWQQVGKIVMDGFDYSNQISVVAMLKDKFFIQPKNK